MMDRLKKKIHGSKIPLSLRGQRMMAVVYMVGPIVGGTMVMKWAMGKEENNRVSGQTDTQAESSRTMRHTITDSIRAFRCVQMSGCGAKLGDSARQMAAATANWRCTEAVAPNEAVAAEAIESPHWS